MLGKSWECICKWMGTWKVICCYMESKGGCNLVAMEEVHERDKCKNKHMKWKYRQKKRGKKEVEEGEFFK